MQLCYSLANINGLERPKGSISSCGLRKYFVQQLVRGQRDDQRLPRSCQRGREPHRQIRVRNHAGMSREDRVTSGVGSG